MTWRLPWRAAVILALLVGACSARGEPDSTGSGDHLLVVASFYPLAEAAQRVGGDIVEVVNLTPPGVEPHDLELAPADVETIQSADLVVYLGGGFQPAIEEAVADMTGSAVDILEGVDTLATPPGAADEGLTVDPHVWLDPNRYRSIVDEIAGALEEALPESAGTFSANAARFGADLDSLDQEFRSRLASCERDQMVTNHAAFGYLADRYGLTQQGISGLAPESEPTPERLAELVRLVEQDGVTTIFTEELLPPDVAETLADEAGVEVAVLDTLEVPPRDGGDYVSAMGDNLETLRLALGCS
jgi:zinc transport system substrate-binding protein